MQLDASTSTSVPSHSASSAPSLHTATVPRSIASLTSRVLSTTRCSHPIIAAHPAARSRSMSAMPTHLIPGVTQHW